MAEPKEEKSWKDFPAELKAKCIEKMDFKTRWTLRQTSRTEKELVENSKCPMDSLEMRSVGPCHEYLQVIAPGYRFRIVRNRFTDDFLCSIMATLLKMGTFMRVSCGVEELVSGVMAKMTTPLETELLHLTPVTRDTWHVLPNCEGLEVCTLAFHTEDRIVFEEFWAAWQPTNTLVSCSVWEIHSIEVDSIMMLIEKTIEDGSYNYGRYQIYLTSPFENSLEVEDRVRQRFGDAVTILGERTVRIQLEDAKNVTVDCYPNKIIIQPLTDRALPGNAAVFVQEEEEEDGEEGDAGLAALLANLALLLQ